MKQPLISIVTPSFNQGKYIRETIESVLSQDCALIEYIVVDGGSSDGTLEILKEYEGRLSWISEKDRGPEDAINKGFRMAKGEILAWIASDDTYLPGAVRRAVAAFVENPGIGMVYGRAHYIDKCGKILGECPTEPFDPEYLAVCNVVAQPSAFFTRGAFDAAGELSLELRQITDYDLWVRIARHVRPLYLPEFLSNYRLHDEAKTLGFHDPLVKFRENIEITLKYFQWAPANRVYPFCYYHCKQTFPAWILNLDPLVKAIALLYSLFTYLKLNRGIKFRDLRWLPRNLKKFFGAWELEDILKESLTER